MANIKVLLNNLNIKYKDIQIYEEAFTHKTFSNESSYEKDYQRLEFLGDAILEKLVTVYLYEQFSDATEGEMSIARSKHIKGESLAKVSQKMGLIKFIRSGKSNDAGLSKNVHEDIFEAFIGALYLDKGEAEVKRILSKFIFPLIKKEGLENLKNPKTKLQEFLQSESRKIIKYETKKIKGGFEAKVFHDNNLFGTGRGNSKKEAEVKAASNALGRLGKNEIN